MLLASFILMVSLGILMVSADKFVEGAASIAHSRKLPTIVIGMTVLAFGSSAPEMVIAASAALAGITDTAIGNVIGSNITNIGLILGLTAVIAPVMVSKSSLKELPVFIGCSILVGVLMFGGTLGYIEGVILLLCFVAFLAYQFHRARHGANEREDDVGDSLGLDEIDVNVPINKAVILCVFGFIGLIASSQTTVMSAMYIAEKLLISDLVIGLTVIALGTSLPELATSLASIKKGEHDMAIGNVIGSNIFNVLAVLGIPALLSPSIIDTEAITRDFPVMMAFTAVMVALCFVGKVNRVSGFILLISYIAYQYHLLIG
ncbi:putative antiporter CaxA [Vibrio chagasii]|nr:putative antiporter CaxA [Vibrio chagasii]